jgi:hypothetical protein
MTLGILNRKARDKEHAWRTLGYVTNYAKEYSRGQKIFVDSGHVAAHEMYMDDSDEGKTPQILGKTTKLLTTMPFLPSFWRVLSSSLRKG